MARVLADYIASSYRGIREIGLVAKLHANEQAQFEYLPDPSWMLQVGYEPAGLGLYLFSTHGVGGVICKVEVLSQTSTVLLFRNDHFVAGQKVKSKKQLMAFLQEHQFPVPPANSQLRPGTN